MYIFICLYSVTRLAIGVKLHIYYDLTVFSLEILQNDGKNKFKVGSMNISQHVIEVIKQGLVTLRIIIKCDILGCRIWESSSSSISVF